VIIVTNKYTISNSSQAIQTYSEFKKTLSETESENFLNFCEEKTRNLSQPVNDIEAWLASKNKAGQNRWEVYYQNFTAFQQALPKKSQANGKTQMQMHQEALEQQRQQAMKAFKDSEFTVYTPPQNQ